MRQRAAVTFKRLKENKTIKTIHDMIVKNSIREQAAVDQRQFISEGLASEEMGPGGTP